MESSDCVNFLLLFLSFINTFSKLFGVIESRITELNTLVIIYYFKQRMKIYTCTRKLYIIPVITNIHLVWANQLEGDKLV